MAAIRTEADTATKIYIFPNVNENAIQIALKNAIPQVITREIARGTSSNDEGRAIFRFGERSFSIHWNKTWAEVFHGQAKDPIYFHRPTVTITNDKEIIEQPTPPKKQATQTKESELDKKKWGKLEKRKLRGKTVQVGNFYWFRFPDGTATRAKLRELRELEGELVIRYKVSGLTVYLNVDELEMAR